VFHQLEAFPQEELLPQASESLEALLERFDMAKDEYGVTLVPRWIQRHHDGLQFAKELTV
jgi:hypothetical protein